MRVSQVEFAPYRPALAGNGFAVSYGRLTALDHRLLRLRFEDGAAVVGEVIRMPGRATDEAAAMEDRLLPLLRGAAFADLPALAATIRGQGPSARGLALAVECAFHDMLGRRSGLPVSVLLGGPAEGDVPALLGLSCETPDEMAAAFTARGAGHANVQIKLGTGSLEDDIARIRALLPLLEPGQTLYADFNGVLTYDLASEALAQIDHPALVWEEPCRTLDDNLALAYLFSRPILLDQCIDSLDGYRRALTETRLHGVSIKPFYLGGLAPARTARDLCAAAGVRFRIDGPWCGPVGAAASLHLALGAPPELLLFSADLTDPLAENGRAMRHPAPGRVAPPPGPGLGVGTTDDLDWTAVQ